MSESYFCRTSSGKSSIILFNPFKDGYLVIISSNNALSAPPVCISSLTSSVETAGFISVAGLTALFNNFCKNSKNVTAFGFVSAFIFISISVGAGGIIASHIVNPSLVSPFVYTVAFTLSSNCSGISNLDCNDLPVNSLSKMSYSFLRSSWFSPMSFFAHIMLDTFKMLGFDCLS